MKIRTWPFLFMAALVATRAQGKVCQQARFAATIASRASYSRAFAPDFVVRLTPMKDDWGWVLSVGPKNSDEDWSAPVTFPIRTREQQVIGTGYGSTVCDKLSRLTVAQFVLTEADYVQYAKMAQEALVSTKPETAGEFIKQVAQLSKGEVTLRALKYECGDTPEAVRWMRFSDSIVLPLSPEAHGRDGPRPLAPVCWEGVSGTQCVPELYGLREPLH